MTQTIPATNHIDRPFLREELLSEVKVGRAVRAVSPGGRRTFVGPVGRVKSGRGFQFEAIVAGVTIDARWSVYPSSSIEAFVPAPLEVTAEEIRDIIADLEAEGGSALNPVGIADICKYVIGFDPVYGRTNRGGGGRSAGAWMREHFAVSKAEKAIAELVDDGVIMKVSQPSSREEKAAEVGIVSYWRRRAGWVTVAAYDERTQQRADERRAAKIEKLRVEAQQIVAARYPDEVEAELDRLLAGV
ncbi:hypothetical protein ACFVAJ_17860 [Agromyces sp. NPDC057679]|uniref:hypothetical protein n=1 Tax=Agromyces sp. NPDC057679 TaxID=3346207 RepID=UPI00366B44FA